jgi:predicted membrane protein
LSPAEILLAVGIGGSLEALAFALGSEIIWTLILTNLFLGLAVAFAVIFSAIILYYLFRRRSEREPGA